MKNIFLRLAFVVTVSLSVLSCGICKRIKGNGDGVVAGASQNMYSITYDFNGRQLDSLCQADTLPVDLSDGWIRRTYQDYETKSPVIKYMYIKEMNDNYEMIYFVTPKGDRFIVSKRKVEVVEE